MNRKFIILAMITTIVLLIFIAVGLTKPVLHNVGNYEISFTVDDPCTGEVFWATGTIFYNVQLNYDSQGGIHWQNHVHHNIQFISSDGTKYQVISVVNEKGNLKNLSYPWSWSFVNTSPLICQGKESNKLFKIRQKITINANGETTVDFYEEGFECRG